MEINNLNLEPMERLRQLVIQGGKIRAKEEPKQVEKVRKMSINFPSDAIDPEDYGVFEETDVYTSDGPIKFTKALDMDKVYFAFIDFYSQDRRDLVNHRKGLIRELSGLTLDFNNQLDSNTLNLDTILAAAYIRKGWSNEDTKRKTTDFIRRLKVNGEKTIYWQRIGNESYQSYISGLITMGEDYEKNLPPELRRICDVQQVYDNMESGFFLAQIVSLTEKAQHARVNSLKPYSSSSSDLMRVIDSICPRFSEDILRNGKANRFLE